MSYRVFTAGFLHETHSFSPLLTGIEAFTAEDGVVEGDAILERYRGTSSEMGGFIAEAETFGWNLLPAVFASTTPSGPVTEDAFEFFVNKITDKLIEVHPVDGVALVLHGAMVVPHLEDAECEIVRRIRAIVGKKIPIAVTFDLHGNISHDLARTVDIVTAYRTTPHVDQFETGARAARLLQRTMTGEIVPVVSYAQLPMLDVLDQGRTIAGYGPMVETLAKAQAAEEAHPAVLDVAVLPGFEWSDKYCTGPSILCTTNDDSIVGDSVCRDLIDYAWSTRGTKTIELLSPEKAMEIAKGPQTGNGPLLIGDYTDCPGAAGTGDNVELLRWMVQTCVEGATLASIADSASVEACHAAGVGETVELSLGGKLDPNYSGEPLKAEARVLKLSEDGVGRRTGPYFTGTPFSYGRSCLVDIAGVKVIIATNRQQIDDQAQFRIFGIEPSECNIVACKAVNHFRADFEPISRDLIYVDVGGIASWRFEQFPYKNLRRPIWPLDDLGSSHAAPA